MPNKIISLLSEGAAGFKRLQDSVFLAADKFDQSTKKGELDGEQSVIFRSLQELTPEERRSSEAVDIVIARSDTTATTLTLGLYNILSNPEIKSRLRAEIDSVELAPGAVPDLVVFGAA